MIQLTRLNGQPLIVNSDLIKLIENAPDTVITLLGSEKIVVRETSDVVIDRIVAFRRRLLEGLPLNFSGGPVSQEPDPAAKRKDPASGAE
jgi:flagellar protein FlbD